MSFTKQQIADMVAEFAVDVVADSALDELSKNPNFSKYMMQLIDRGYTEVFTISPTKLSRSRIQEDNPWLKFASFEDSGDFLKYRYLKLVDTQVPDNELKRLIDQVPIRSIDKVGIELNKKHFYSLFITDIGGIKTGITQDILDKYVYTSNNFKQVKSNFIKLMDNIRKVGITHPSFIDDAIEILNKANSINDIKAITNKIISHSKRVDVNVATGSNYYDMPEVGVSGIDLKDLPEEDIIPFTSTNPTPPGRIKGGPKK